MSNYIFQQLAKRGRAQGIKSSEAKTWFRDSARNITSVNRNALLQDKKNLQSRISNEDIGSMFMYFYDAKHKKTLPYYDAFPLIFVVETYSDGFLGINLHYLPVTLRARLMDGLYSLFDKKDKLLISYKTLKALSRLNLFNPCLKRYLTNHVQSNFLKVEVNHWDMALMLPTQKFIGASIEEVYRDSRGKI